MDLIYTNANRVDQGALQAYEFDLSYGASENDFEIIVDANESALEYGSAIYIEGTEYGGIVDTMKASTNGSTIAFSGKTWHGILNNKVITPNSGEDYYSVTAQLVSNVIEDLIREYGLNDLFRVIHDLDNLIYVTYTFPRYCKLYDGIRGMLAAKNLKLKMEWKDGRVHLSTVPIVDYSEATLDNDIVSLSIEQHNKKVNHLICLGKGELADREVIHLYANADGNLQPTPYYTGLDEVVEVYDNSGADSDKLEQDGIKRFQELLDCDKAEISIGESDEFTYDIGDIVGASELRSGISVSTAVTQKIVKIKNGVISTDYKIGE